MNSSQGRSCLKCVTCFVHSLLLVSLSRVRSLSFWLHSSACAFMGRHPSKQDTHWARQHDRFTLLMERPKQGICTCVQLQSQMRERVRERVRERESERAWSEDEVLTALNWLLLLFLLLKRSSFLSSLPLLPSC